MSDLKPNAELAYLVLDHIDAHPEQWRQRWWLTKGECGTQACFAGWACILSGDLPDISDDDKVGDDAETITTPDGGMLYVPQRATNLLGVADQTADELFYASNTRQDLGRLVAEIFGPRPAPVDEGVPTSELPEYNPDADLPPNAGSQP